MNTFRLMSVRFVLLITNELSVVTSNEYTTQYLIKSQRVCYDDFIIIYCVQAHTSVHHTHTRWTPEIIILYSQCGVAANTILY